MHIKIHRAYMGAILRLALIENAPFGQTKDEIPEVYVELADQSEARAFTAAASVLLAERYDKVAVVHLFLRSEVITNRGGSLRYLLVDASLEG